MPVHPQARIDDRRASGPVPCGRSRPGDRRCRDRLLKSSISLVVANRPSGPGSTSSSIDLGHRRLRSDAGARTSRRRASRRRRRGRLARSARWLRMRRAGRSTRIMISPRLVGRQLDRPIEKPGQGSGVRIGRSPALGNDGREGLEVELHVGPRPASGRCGRSRRHGSGDSDSGPPRKQEIPAARPASLPHHGLQDLVEGRHHAP